MALTPLQPTPVARGNVSVAAYHEQGDDRNRRWPELVRERCCRLVVVQRPEPIDDLIEAAAETWRPVGAVPLTRGEQAAWCRILDLNETVCSPGSVARDDVGDELTVEPDLNAETITGGGASVV